MAVEHEPPQAPVSIDATNAWVWQGGRRLELAPKSFAVLRYLVEKAGQLVTKEELHAAVWGETVVSEAALLTCIRDIRKALGDASRTPHYVETVHRRGFRFIGPIAATPPVASGQYSVVSSQAAAEDEEQKTKRAAFSPAPSPRLVGRETELTRLRRLLDKALTGERQLVFVTGEPGIGKTALVEQFLESLGNRTDLHLSHGQCIEHYGAGDAYLPLLEMGARLCQGPEGAQAIALLRQYAPTWLVQLPGVLPESEWEQ